MDAKVATINPSNSRDRDGTLKEIDGFYVFEI